MQRPGQGKSSPNVSPLLIILSLLMVAGVVVVLFHGWGYYVSGDEQRMLSPQHKLFKASGAVGIICGVVSTALFLTNLLYLPRRRYAEGLKRFGPLNHWLSWHVISGLGGAAIVFLHAAFRVKSVVGMALVASVGIVLITGMVGRYMLRWIPRNRVGELLPMTQIEGAVMELVDELRPLGAEDPAAMAVLERMADTVDSSKGASRIKGFGDTRERLKQVDRDLATLKRTTRAHPAADGGARMDALLKRVKVVYRQAAAFQFASLFMDSWRTFHRVLALFFLVALGFHIGVAIYYGFAGI